MGISPRHVAAVLTLVLALVGCAQKPAEETAGREAAPPKPAPVTLTVPAGTPLEVRLITGLNSKQNNEGDSFTGTLDKPVMVGNQEVIPKGADVAGRVTKAVASGRLKQRAELWVTLTSIEIRGRSYPVDTTTAGHKEGSKATRDILFIGGGAGTGAAIGGATGGGKGAGIGAAIGAGAGTAAAMLTGKRDIKFPPESVLRFALQQNLKVQK